MFSSGEANASLRGRVHVGLLVGLSEALCDVADEVSGGCAVSCF